jgi:hypothetical protein
MVLASSPIANTSLLAKHSIDPLESFLVHLTTASIHPIVLVTSLPSLTSATEFGFFDLASHPNPHPYSIFNIVLFVLPSPVSSTTLSVPPIASATQAGVFLSTYCLG